MPKEAEPGDDAYEVDEDHGGELDIAGTFIPVRIKPHEKLHDSELFQKVEELVEKTRFSEPIDFGYFLALGKVRSDSSLIPGSGAPTETLGNFFATLQLSGSWENLLLKSFSHA